MYPLTVDASEIGIGDRSAQKYVNYIASATKLYETF